MQVNDIKNAVTTLFLFIRTIKLEIALIKVAFYSLHISDEATIPK